MADCWSKSLSVLDLYASKANYELVNGVAEMYADGSAQNEVRAMFAMSILASKKR